MKIETVSNRSNHLEFSDIGNKHVNRQILARPFLPMYKLHKYWGRKPWNILEQYIRNYTKRGEILLDPFCGSGVAVAEALKLGRRAIAIDINPIATFIARQTVTPVDLLAFEFSFKDIVSEIEGFFRKEYRTECRSCHQEASVIHFLWSRESLPKGVRLTGELERNLASVRYFCQRCKEVREDIPIEVDLVQADKKYGKLIEDCIPSIIQSPNMKLVSTTRTSEASVYTDLFTKRNFYLLTVLYSAIQKIEDKSIKEIMTLVFTSALEKSSKLLMFTKKGVKVGVRSKSWVAPRFHIQREYLEKNPLINFKNSFVRVFRGKQESNRLIQRCTIGDSVDDVLSGKADVFFSTANAQFLKDLPDSSVDYVIADPPFVKDIKYLELSQLWSNWIGYVTNWDEEIKIESLGNVDLQKYVDALTNAFGAMHRALKPKKFLSLLYHTEDVELWNILAKCPVTAGFTVEKFVPQGVRYSYGAKYRTFITKTSKAKAFIGHYYVTLSKATTEKPERTRSTLIDLKARVVRIASLLIKKRNEGTPLIFIIMNLYENLGSDEISEITIQNIINSLDESSNLEKDETNPSVMWQKWRLKGPLADISIPTLRDQVKEHLEEVLLFERNKSTIYHIQGTLNKFTGDLMVSNQRVMNLLDELSEPIEGKTEGRLLRDKDGVAKKINERLIKNLIELGKQYKFSSFAFKNIGKCANPPKSRFEQIFFEQFGPEEHEQFRKLDVMWLKEEMPLVLFHMVLTEKMCDSLGLANDLYGKLALNIQGFQKVLVVPETLKEEVLGSTAIKEHWDYILIEELEMFLVNKGILERAVKHEIKEDDQKAKKLKAKVVDKIMIPSVDDAKYFKLVLETNHVERIAKAGQFVNILCTAKELTTKLEVFTDGDSYDEGFPKILKDHRFKDSPLLRRPISIHRIYYEGFNPYTLKGIRELPSDMQRLLHPGKRSKFDVLIKIVGVGTKLLSMVKPGSTLDIVGPLGNWFSLREDLGTALLVAGGIGIAPLYALAERLRWEGKEVILFFGAYDKTDLSVLGYDLGIGQSFSVEDADIESILDEFQKLGIEIHVSTVVGKTGHSGPITDFFQSYVSDKILIDSSVEVFSCGPKGMLKALAEITDKHKLKHQVLMEEIMGCGVGACMSCVCPIKVGSRYEFRRVCTDGPVFMADEVMWGDS